MTDHLNVVARSVNMAAVRGKDTTPELAVRKLVHAMGYRFRLHGENLPGKPDLVFAGKKKVIFVHGCFWHRHNNCPRASMPKTRTDFWQTKFNLNVERDQRVVQLLKKDGWKTLTIWECEIRNEGHLKGKVNSFLDDK